MHITTAEQLSEALQTIRSFWLIDHQGSIGSCTKVTLTGDNVTFTVNCAATTESVTDFLSRNPCTSSEAAKVVRRAYMRGNQDIIAYARGF